MFSMFSNMKDFINFRCSALNVLAIFGALLLQQAKCSITLGPSNQSEAYFNGSSYLRLHTMITLKKNTGLSFRTCEGGSLFSQQQNDDLIEMSVNSEGLILVIRTLGKHYEEQIKGNYINNRWHTTYLQYRLGNVTLSIDGNAVLVSNSTYNTDLLTSPGLYNEGAVVLLIGKQFNGCILEGPSLVFDQSIIMSSPNVKFELCPLTDDSCIPREDGFDFCLTEPCLKQGTCINGKTSYTCTCLPRYTGKNCEIDFGDPCDKKPPICKNNGICKSSNSGEYSCVCPNLYTGRHCETEVTVDPLCKNNPCVNQGLCIVNEITNLAKCICPAGFEGSYCENNLDECNSNPCKNGGLCLDGFNNFTCDCSKVGYTGNLCQVDINECLTKPCLNQGICFNTYGSFICQCALGYSGVLCNLLTSECLSKPCLNGGTCIEKNGDYKCQCSLGYAGNDCEIELQNDVCQSITCNLYGECVKFGRKSGNCVCRPDFPGSYPNCTVDPICLPNPCRNGGICSGLKQSFNCSCLPGFTGKLCQVNLDECQSSPCLNGGTCIDITNGFICNCTEDWMGIYCEKPYNICDFEPCKNNGTCVNALKKYEYKCNCLSGFDGLNCENNIDNCVNVECLSGKTCIDLVNDYECKCLSDHGVNNCTIDSDPCTKNTCLNNGICKADKNVFSAHCVCSAGYTGKSCESDIDECIVSSRPICHNGICINNFGSYQCYCQPGFTGEQCTVDFDECLSMPCQNNATCLNKINKFECVCLAGYTGTDCSINIDECQSMPCATGSTCTDGINGYICICQSGLTGQKCEINIDDCESRPCQNGGQCIDGLNVFSCDCTGTGYKGRVCETNIDECFENPCQNGGFCVDGIKDYDCNCIDGYTGKNCEIDINECQSNPCKYNGTCLEKSNKTLYGFEKSEDFNFGLPEFFNKPFNISDSEGFVCLCIMGVTGDHCETNINDCESSPCFQGICIDHIGGYVCECEDGYEGQRCELDIDECQKYKPCVHGTCVDKRSNYLCKCQPQYGGKNCSVELIGCKNSPCLNDGHCKPFLLNESIHTFNCSCPNGYQGDSCEKVTTMSFSKISQVTINTTRDEGYDIQFRFKTTLGDGLLALGKGLTYYILELSKGRLNLHSSLLNKWEGVFIGSNLNDSNWQKVFVAINSSHLVLSANDEQTIYPINFNDNYNVSSTSFVVTYIGGIPSNLRKLTHGQTFLVGCMEDVVVNGQWLIPELSNISSVAFNDVEKGCLREPQCNPNPCHSGGRCTDKWRDFTCNCERPFLGRTCQYNFTAATFGYENITESIVTVTVADYARRAVRSVVDISMFIKTRQTKGQIFYLGSVIGSVNFNEETYIAAQLDSGELLVRIQFNGTLEAYTVGGVKLDNGWNHLIQVIRNITLVQVKLNGTEYFRKTISASGALDAQVLFLGGLPQLRSVRQADNASASKVETISPSASASSIAPSLSNIQFKGIIHDVQISNGTSTMIVEFYPLDVIDLDLPSSFGTVTFDRTLVLKGINSDDLCKHNPCSHNGQCFNTWNDYRCECPRGFKGKDCAEMQFCELEKCPLGTICKNLENGYECIANATFDGTQEPLQYILNSTKSIYLDTIFVTYRTRSWGTIFFAKYLSNYFVIFIYYNQVIVEWRINEQFHSKKFFKDNFQGQWVSLIFVAEGTTFKGGFEDNVFDENPNFQVNNFNYSKLSDLLTHGTIYIAGSDNVSFHYSDIISTLDFNKTGYIPVVEPTSEMTNSLENTEIDGDIFFHKVDQNKPSDKFKGCMGEIRIGGLLLHFFPNSEVFPKGHYAEEFFEMIGTRPNIGCTLCFSSDCFNEGFCMDSLNTYKCKCKEGFTADDCSINIDECEKNQCQNNGTCIDLTAKYKCDCQVGFEGEYCEHEIDECLSNPCEHGATCIDQIGNFECECLDGYVGKQCESPLLKTCDNEPCKGRSTCLTETNHLTGNNFTCLCTEGMDGVFCDIPFCLIKPCKNGYCNTTVEVPYCQCHKGFDGVFCENNIDDCLLSSSNGSCCQNGGLCIDGVNRYDCLCTYTGYSGLLCEIDIDECQQNVDICGEGKCENLPGSFRCDCDNIPGRCGHGCLLEDPCFKKSNPCNHGTCMQACSNISDYYCLCNEHYMGKNCTNFKVSANINENGFNILYVVTPILLILFIAIAIGLAILVNIARNKRATRGTYSPSAQEFCNPRVELENILKPPPEERLI